MEGCAGWVEGVCTQLEISETIGGGNDEEAVVLECSVRGMLTLVLLKFHLFINSTHVN